MSAPGWYPNPDGSDSMRYWNGQQWTSVTPPTPTPTHASPTDNAPSTESASVSQVDPERRKRNNRIALGLCAGGAVVLAGIAAIGSGGDKSDSEPDAKSAAGESAVVDLASIDDVSEADARASCDDAVAIRFPNSPDPSAYAFTTSRQGESFVTTGQINSEGVGSGLMAFTCVTKNTSDGLTSEITSASPAASPEELAASRAAAEPIAPAPGPSSPARTPVDYTSDPRCQPGEPRYDAMIASGLLDGSLSLANSQMIIDDGMVFYGVSTVRPDGKFENRSDVWVIDTIPYSSTGGARNTTSWSKASDRLRIFPDDERVQAVDNCVVNLTRN